MERLKVEDLQPGMRVKNNIFDRYGKLLLAEGTILRPQYIRKLELYGVAEVVIEKMSMSSIGSTKMQTSESDIVYSEAFDTVKDIMDKIRNSKSFDVAAVVDTVEEIVNQIVSDPQIFLRISSIRDIDNYTYLHSIDVCIYSIIMGKNMGLDIKNLKKLGLGAFLHDIGKAKIPNSILLKPGPLTEDEYEMMKNHTTFGYEILTNTPNLDRVVANIALQHHEHWDGKGYPRQLRELNIDIFARIVTVCDIYDALTGNRIYRGRILPHEAAEYVINNSGTIADPSLTKIFVNNVAVYPIGATVLLSTGEIGKVHDANPGAPLRPIVDVFGHRDPRARVYKRKINLMEELTIFIVDVIN